jgi:membrane protein
MVPGIEALARSEFCSIGGDYAAFATIFKFLPDAKIAWHDVWIGALITTALFTVGKFAWAFIWEERG